MLNVQQDNMYQPLSRYWISSSFKTQVILVTKGRKELLLSIFSFFDLHLENKKLFHYFDVNKDQRGVKDNMVKTSVELIFFVEHILFAFSK